MSAKSTISHTVRVSHVVRVPGVTLAKGAAQLVKFRTTRRGVFCTSKGLPKLLVRQTENGKFEAGVWDAAERQALGTILTHRNPAKVFARAVRSFWAPELVG